MQRPEQLESRLLSHMRGLLDDPRLRVDTRAGLRPANSFRQHVTLDTGADGEDGFPPGHLLDVSLLRQKWILLAEVAGRVYLRVLSDVGGEETGGAVSSPVVVRLLTAVTGLGTARVPTTVVLASTTGFTPEARELAERRAERTVILVEPNGVGGFRVHGPNETRAITELFDPETDEEKRARLRTYVTARQADLRSAGLSSEKLALATMLPETFVEAEIKSIVHELPGWASRRLDGRTVLFRQDAALASTPATESDSSPMRIGGVQVYPTPGQMVERIGSLFARKGENEKKITYISERRSTLGQFRDRLYEELNAIEARETQLKNDYVSHPPPGLSGPSSSAIEHPKTIGMAKRRVAAQLLRLRSEGRRRHEQVAQLNAMIGTLGMHLQQLELARTGVANDLAEGASIAGDVSRAEQLLAECQPAPDLGSMLRKVPMLSAEVSEEEVALLAELESLGATGVRAETNGIKTPSNPTSAPTMRIANGSHHGE